jgi:citrate lyase beta subunit
MARSIPARDLSAITARLRTANTKLAAVYPGDSLSRQPVHTLICGGDAFRRDYAQTSGAAALAALDEFAPTAAAFAKIVGLTSLADTVRARVIAKLKREPVEDLRLDFEDGYGARPDAEEDGHAQSAAEEMAAGMDAGTLPPFIGIRIKAMSRELHARSLRTLDLFVTALVKSGKRLPANFAILVPKVMTAAHVDAVVRACIALERRLKLPRQSLQLELMFETPQSILTLDGSSALRALVAAGQGRVRGVHFGVYDYTALCGITAAWQHPRHLACDFARHIMQVALAQTGVFIADGGSNVMPIPPHLRREARPLTDAEQRENAAVVHGAWKTHFTDVTHSLVNAYYQGWDLHPGQLPTRYAAVYAFYLSARPAATARIKRFFDKAAKAGAVFDDAATGQALVNFFSRAWTSGAITLEELKETGLQPSDLQGRSFLQILASHKSG